MGNFNRGGNFGRRGFNRSGGRGSGRFGRGDSGRFNRGGSGRFGRRDSNRSSRPEMHEVICDKCGSECEVPFKPTEGKPVYCSDCFKKRNNSESSESRKPSREEFDQLNRKLDRILKILEAAKEQIVEEPKEKEQPELQEKKHKKPGKVS